MKALYFDGDNGEIVREEEIPAALQDEAEAARHEMLEALSMYSDELMEKLLGEEEVPEELIHDIIRARRRSNQEFTPVFLGSAFKNKGVQPLLDAITRYLPSPTGSRQLTANDPEGPEQEDHARAATPRSRSSAWRSRSSTTNTASSPTPASTRATLPRASSTTTSVPARRNASAASCGCTRDKREEIDTAAAGDIVAIMGIDCASGDTYCSRAEVLHAGKHLRRRPGDQDVDQPAVARQRRQARARRSQRFRKEDPTFHVATDEETGETVIAGMGELHLEIYVERIRREYGVEVEVGAPKVSYRESGTAAVTSSTTSTRSRPVVRASTVTSSAAMSPMTEEDRAEGRRRRIAVRRQGDRRSHSRRTTSRPSKRASAR